MWELLIIGGALLLGLGLAYGVVLLLAIRTMNRRRSEGGAPEYDLPIEFWHKGWKVSIILLASGSIGYNVMDINEAVLYSGTADGKIYTSTKVVELKKKIDRKVWDDAYDIHFREGVL